MRIRIRGCEAVVLTATIVLTLLVSILLLVTSQPPGYTLVHSAEKAYDVEGADWMNFKALYMKTKNNRLYFYVEYYGAIPISGDYYRAITIFMDTDKDPQTGQSSMGLGLDYFIHFTLYGDGFSPYAGLYEWSSGDNQWIFDKGLTSNMVQNPGLSYMEVWVDQQDIGNPIGIDLYLQTYSYVKAIPSIDSSYTIGSSVRQITVDGDASDWGTVAPLVTFPSRSISPPELEASSIYVANDDENLYIRIDTRGTPTTSISSGWLFRQIFVFLDTDNNDNTGYTAMGGAEFYEYAYFNTYQLGKITEAIYYRYVGTGSDWNWQGVAVNPSASDFNSVFETKIPLSYLGIGSGQQVGIYIQEEEWYLFCSSPKLAYPATAPTPIPTLTPTPTPTPTQTPTPTSIPTPTPSGATGFFGSETILIAVTAIVIVIIISVIIMMRKRPPPSPPPA